MPWTSAQPTPTLVLSDHISERLRFMIISGEIPDGTHLSEPRLAEVFDVSRGPVREALHRLELEGLVATRRRKVFAVGLTSEDIAELYAIREGIEVLALRLARARTDAADWAASLRALDTMRVAAEEHRHDDYARADLAFHSSLYALSGSRRLYDIWRQYEPTFAVLLQITNAEDIDLGPSLESHAAILETTRSGRLDDAVSELQEHLLGARTRMVHAHARFTPPSHGKP